MREVRGVEVDAEALAVPDRVERLPRRGEVVGDLGRVHLEREAHALLVEHVDDRVPALGEVLVAALDVVPVVGRERVEHVPDGRAGEAGHDLDAEPRGGPRRVLHLLGGPLPDALRVAVAPDVLGQDALVARVDRVADGLADEVRADRPAVEPVALEQLALRAAVAVVAKRLVDLEVVAPAGELEAVEVPLAALGGELLERQVRPLAGEQRDWSCHLDLLSSGGGDGFGGDLDGDAGAAVARQLLGRQRRASTISRSSSSGRQMVSSELRPNLDESISATLRSATARAALTTSASGRREVVSPCSSVMPAADRNAMSMLRSARNSIAQRPAIRRMCWSTSPGTMTTWI